MDSAKAFPLGSKVTLDMANYWVEQMKLNLQAKRKRTSIRAKWEKVGNKWQVVEAHKKTFRANYVSSGELVNSMQVEGTGLDLFVSMPSYAEYLINGRKPGKGIPPKVMQEWTKQKKIRPRDMASGQFIKNSLSNQNAMRFMMNRKIKHFGIEGFDFVGYTRDYVAEKYRPELTKALKQDIINLEKKRKK